MNGFWSLLGRMPPQLLVAIVVGTGITLFAPAAWLVLLGLAQILEDYRGFIGPTFIVSLAWLIALGVPKLSDAYGWMQRRRVRRELLEMLTPVERECLATLYLRQAPCVYIPIGDGRIQNLVRYGMVSCSTKTIDLVAGVPYSLAPWVRKALQRRPSILKGHTGQGFSTAPTDFFGRPRW